MMKKGDSSINNKKQLTPTHSFGQTKEKKQNKLDYTSLSDFIKMNESKIKSRKSLSYIWNHNCTVFNIHIYCVRYIE